VNNFVGTPSTFYFGIDRSLDALVKSDAPNTGVLKMVGSLGVDVTDAAFDVASDNQGYLAMAQGGVTSLYSIDFASGAAANQGQLGTGAAIQGMTVAGLPAFEPASGSIVALKGGNVLVNYDATSPSLILGVLSITGHTGSLVAIDYRPATGELLALSDADLLYSINPVTGAARKVSANPFATALTGTSFGFDVNPAADRVRIVSETDENHRVNPDTGDPVSVDTALQYFAGDGMNPADPNNGTNPQVTAVAYTNNFAGAATTVAYGIDVGLDILVTVDPPNNGTLKTVGALGVSATDASFDITAGDLAYAALAAGGVTRLYTVNLATGAATLVGTLGSGGAVNGLTVKP
jgi:hypothetical protein